ncbi:helix-turn-helix domain-containing protein [Streptomyces sp. NPDC057654]|uniref:helix-turn-helix domain-containing protein n=1 Tax=Streptomyces sp. NPDC057654 TaxID=3346196 RepID=UPI0036B17074
MAKLRREVGLNQRELAGLLFVSQGYVAYIERGIRWPQDLDFVERLDSKLKARDHLVETYCLVERMEKGDAPYADYFAKALALEPEASRIDWYGGSLVPGLLQTREYATALIMAASPFWSPERVKKVVDERLARAAILDAEAGNGPQVLVILDEAALRRPVGGHAVMADQIRHVLAMSRRRVIVQVLPYRAGAHPLLEGQMVVFRFDEDPPIVYTEGSVSGQITEEKEAVDACILMYDLAGKQALSPEDSQEFITSVMKEHEGK